MLLPSVLPWCGGICHHTRGRNWHVELNDELTGCETEYSCNSVAQIVSFSSGRITSFLLSHCNISPECGTLREIFYRKTWTPYNQNHLVSHVEIGRRLISTSDTSCPWSDLTPASNSIFLFYRSMDIRQDLFISLKALEWRGSGSIASYLERVFLNVC